MANWFLILVAVLLVYKYIYPPHPDRGNRIRECLVPSIEYLIPRRSFIVEANTFNMRLPWQVEERLECCHRRHYMDLFSSSVSGGQVAWNTWHLPLTCGMSPDMWAALDLDAPSTSSASVSASSARRSSYFKIFPPKICLPLADCLSVVRKILFSLCFFIYFHGGSRGVRKAAAAVSQSVLKFSLSESWCAWKVLIARRVWPCISGWQGRTLFSMFFLSKKLYIFFRKYRYFSLQ